MSAQVRLQDTWLLLCAAAGVLIGDSQYVMDTEHTDADWHSLSLSLWTNFTYLLINQPIDWSALGRGERITHLSCQSAVPHINVLVLLSVKTTNSLMFILQSRRHKDN